MTETRRVFVFHLCSIVMSRHFSKSEYLMMCYALDRGDFMLVSQSYNERYCTTGNIMNNTVTEKWIESIKNGLPLFRSHQHGFTVEWLQTERTCVLLAVSLFFCTMISYTTTTTTTDTHNKIILTKTMTMIITPITIITQKQQQQ